MPYILVAITTHLILLAAPAAALAQAQEDAPAPRAARGRGLRSRPGEMHNPVVVRLDHANCVEVADILGHVMTQGLSYPDPRSNSIVFVGPESAVKAARLLINELDQPAEEDQAQDVVMVRVSHRSAEELAGHISRILSSRQLKMAADEARSTVLLRGSARAVAAARAAVEQLDVPAATVNLEFAFFHADLNATDASPSNIPDDLAMVAQELRRFGGLKLLGRLSTIAVENEDFAVQGGISGNLSTQVRGTLLAPAGAAVKLNLRAELVLEKAPSGTEADEGKRSPRRPIFELKTVVTTERGAYVVLGSAPAGWNPGESAILVLHVRP